MAPKRKHKADKTKELKWKSVAIESLDGFTNEDFDGLVAIEELDTYNTLDDKIIECVNNKKSTKKNKKLKKSKNSNSSTNIEKSIDLSTIEPDKDVNSHLDMSQWIELSIDDHIIRCLRELNMPFPTPIQKQTIKDAIMDRKNIYGAAPTGSGKTLAFAIPVVNHIMQDKSRQTDDNILRAIVLTPTRELAVQIKKHIENISIYNGLKTALVVGGLAIQKQERILLRKKPDIVVATPGRLWEIVNGGTVDYLNRNSLAQIKYLVIDEADRMIEKAHFKELRHIIEFLNLSTNLQRQIFIFSATLTMNKKKPSKSLKNKECPNENLIDMLNLDQSSFKMCDLTEMGTKSKPSSEQLQEYIIHCMQDDKDLYLYYFIISNPGRTIVFCNSIDCIRRLVNIFRFLQLNPLAVHSSMPQKRRLTSIEKFTLMPNMVLIATDVAARGLDIPSVDHVVHYQVPRTADIYVHRSGRTARITNKGLNLIICDPQEEAFFLKDFSKILNKESLSEYTVNSSILKRLKERIKLAQVCDTLEHKLRKERSNENWFKITAKACEIYDSDMNSSDDDENDFENAATVSKANDNRKLKAYRKQLSSMLRQKIVFPR